jgi:hypothetical protein
MAIESVYTRQQSANEGPGRSLKFQVITQFLVPSEGLEPPAFWSEARRSIR